MTYDQANQISAIITAAHRIVIIQADNPDADSLGSSLALEHMLGDMGKDVALFCGVDIPTYLRYLEGWDRVEKELPHQFDAVVIVDASTATLLERLESSGQFSRLRSKPSIVIDHHGTVNNPLSFANVLLCSPEASSTGEVLFHLAKQSSWPISIAAGTNLMAAILGDTQGLSNDLASPTTYHVMAALLELGVNRPLLEEHRRELSKMSAAIFRYKARLIERTLLSTNGYIASVDIPQVEINTYSPQYNPVPLIQGDMLAISGVAVAIVFKDYDDGRVTAAIRCNNGYGIANKIAEYMNGGGHPYASGFKVVHGKSFNEVKAQCLEYTAKLLMELAKKKLTE